MERKPYSRTTSQKISDEVRNKPLHEDIAWREHRAQTMRELLDQQARAYQQYQKENANGKIE